jgi:hypothetical protein
MALSGNASAGIVRCSTRPGAVGAMTGRWLFPCFVSSRKISLGDGSRRGSGSREAPFAAFSPAPDFSFAGALVAGHVSSVSAGCAAADVAGAGRPG